MGTYRFPTLDGELLPLLVSILKNLLLSLQLQILSAAAAMATWAAYSSNLRNHGHEGSDGTSSLMRPPPGSRVVPITLFKCHRCGISTGYCDTVGSGAGITECCCICLCGFEAEEEVSELLPCKHYFHRGCLERWFEENRGGSCPLCRSSASLR